MSASPSASSSSPRTSRAGHPRARCAWRSSEASTWARVKELIGIVSHDLRNPLNASLLSSTQLLRRQWMDALQARCLVRVVSSAERAARLIHDLLDFTQVRLGDGLAIHRRPTDLQGRALQVVEEVRLGNPGREVQMEHRGTGASRFLRVSSRTCSNG
nr:histidine kinase dimerization/phospho-acceptor domain-containing protein [Myxococcus sp. CA039A]